MKSSYLTENGTFALMRKTSWRRNYELIWHILQVVSCQKYLAWFWIIIKANKFLNARSTSTVFPQVWYNYRTWSETFFSLSIPGIFKLFSNVMHLNASWNIQINPERENNQAGRFFACPLLFVLWELAKVRRTRRNYICPLFCEAARYSQI
jgi:hypothetical protein